MFARPPSPEHIFPSHREQLQKTSKHDNQPPKSSQISSPSIKQKTQPHRAEEVTHERPPTTHNTAVATARRRNKSSSIENRKNNQTDIDTRSLQLRSNFKQTRTVRNSTSNSVKMSSNFEASVSNDSETRQQEHIASQPTDFTLSPIDEQYRISKRILKSVKKHQKDVTKAYKTRSQAIQHPNLLRNVAQLALEFSERHFVEPVAEPAPKLRLIFNKLAQQAPKLRLIVKKLPKLRLIVNKPVVEPEPAPKLRLIVKKPAPKLRLIVNKPKPAPKLRLIVKKSALKLRLVINKPSFKLRFRVNKLTPKLRLTFKNSAFLRSLDRQRAQTGSVESGILRTPLPKPERNLLPSTPTSEAMPISSCAPTTRLHLARSKFNKERRRSGKECVPAPTNEPQTADEPQVDEELNERLQRRIVARFTQRQEEKVSATRTEAEKLSSIIRSCEADPRSYKVALPAITPQLEVDIRKSRDTISTLPESSTKPAITRTQDQWTRNYLPTDRSPLAPSHKRKEPMVEPQPRPKRMRLWNDNVDITELPF
ncbi:hypothetical protein BDZ45DRAFT_726341 [Acephala macrosclerotiorum]|nr:hypothetical protein BDZ45DRAFT_726341 [Acephala macrosclerotiorum]